MQSRHKTYYEQNKERVRNRVKAYYHKNKKEINRRRKEKINSLSPAEKQVYLDRHKKYRIRREEKRKEYSRTSHFQFLKYKNGANKRGYCFSLSKKKFTELYNSQCAYCGKKEAMGVDRVDNRFGYSVKNSVSCCAMCNKMKWSHDKNDFIAHAKRVAKHNS